MPRTKTPKGMVSVYKAYRFELHNLSKSKVRSLYKTFVQSDMAYYKALALCEEDANHILTLETKSEKNKRFGQLQKKLQAIVKPLPFGSALKASVIETVKQQVSSYVELKLSGQNAGYPSKESHAIDYEFWLNQLLLSVDLERESEARDALSMKNYSKYRPLSFEKHRIGDGFKIYQDDKGRLFAFLNLWNSHDKRASKIQMDMIDTKSGERCQESTSLGMLVPLSFSEKQRDALSKGQAQTAKLVATEDGRFFLMVSVLFQVRKQEAACIMGVDRGFDELATFSVRDSSSGKVFVTGSLSGHNLRQHQRKLEAKQKLDQKLGKRYISGWSNYSLNLMHHVANEIVSIADKYKCQVVLEDLSSIKNNPHMKRPKGARKSNFSRMLSRQQYGRLEFLLGYKLACMGLPPPKLVRAAYTSVTCPKCGHADKNNRPPHRRDTFCCTNSPCQYQEHADIVGAHNVAGKFIWYESVKSKMKKGHPLPEQHQYSYWLRQNLVLEAGK
ncbi:zinc ribbon domain-containing protein [Motilimonas eburnea]|uniref:zinc ribbon domain-containing protein n=1 Tax=Motilimonas eburnea TaxID=1737488 RepID=UPI001E303F10|nr:zinc ribbon domain-containing protein [Motilimonas eburnea]MCE2571820.1 transposase [Motilimonas eburnea]